MGQDILAKYLKGKRNEVMVKTTRLFDDEEVLRIRLNNVARESWQKGFKNGFKKGRKKDALNTARRALQLGRYSIEDIAYYTDLTIDEVKRIAASEDLQK